MIDIVEKIAFAKSTEIDELLNAVLDRYAELFPDWEVSTISLERSIDRNEQIDKMIAFLQKLKT